MYLYHRVLKIKNLEYKLKCSTFNYEGRSNLTQNFHGCEPILKDSMLQGQYKCVHAEGKHLEKTVQYEIGKTGYWHAMITVLGQI
jgi:hypothetical protein